MLFPPEPCELLGRKGLDPPEEVANPAIRRPEIGSEEATATSSLCELAGPRKSCHALHQSTMLPGFFDTKRSYRPMRFLGKSFRFWQTQGAQHHIQRGKENNVSQKSDG